MAIRVTQALIYTELQTIKETLKAHSETDMQNFRELRQLLEGSDAAPGIKIRVDRLEQVESTKKYHIGYLWAAVITTLGATVSAFLTR